LSGSFPRGACAWRGNTANIKSDDASAENQRAAALKELATTSFAFVAGEISSATAVSMLAAAIICCNPLNAF